MTARDALDAVNAAWKVGRLIDDRLGDPDPGRLGIWAQMFADAGLIDPHLAADAARSWYAPGRDRVMQPGDVRPAPPGAVNSIERQMSVPRHTAMTPEQITRATILLEDGCSYREAARTIGVSRDVVMRALPGYGWSYADAGRFAASVRWAAR